MAVSTDVPGPAGSPSVPDLADRPAADTRLQELRDDYWRALGLLGSHVDPITDAGEESRWPGGDGDYLRVTTQHTGVVCTDGLSDPGGPGVEVYVEGRELLGEQVPPEGQWLLATLEEVAGAVAGAADSLRGALEAHGLLSLEVSGAQAPTDWISGGRLGVLVGVPLPGRPDGFDTEDARVPMLSVVPLRPSELAVVAAEGPSGRRRVAEALAAAGWYSYAESSRPAVV